MNEKQTIYDFAQAQMGEIVTMLLELSQTTQNFTEPSQEVWNDHIKAEILLCGKGYHIDDIASLPSLTNAWQARLAVPFSIELAATGSLYRQIQVFTDDLITYTYTETDQFKNVTADWVFANPHCLPVFMHVAGSFSKQELKKQIGSVTDKAISRPASIKVTALLKRACDGGIPDKNRVQERIKATVEGIVRDLVGRLLLEQFVASALKRKGIQFKREEEYENLEGVVYDFRADFVVPDEKEPLAFLEVRKSSSRHASLYAKDKMFSAINWKGKHPKCLGVLVVDGPWTDVTLTIMSRVFDYVVPIGQVDEVAKSIRAYVDGDSSVLQWLIKFQILRVEPDGALIEPDKLKVDAVDLADAVADD